jgi:integrase
MGTKLGIRDILAMQPNTILWDTAVPGFHARRQFSDAVTFCVFYRNAEGVQKWHRIGRFGVWTPDQARKEAQRVLRARDMGEDPSAQRKALRESPTVAQVCDEYLKEMQSGGLAKKASTITSDISRIEARIKPALGTRKVTGITRDDVEQFMRTMSPSSARRVTGLLGSIFAFAIKRKLRTDNPAHGIEKPADVKRMRRLSDAEYVQLWVALQSGGQTADMFLLLAITGWRSGEVRTLKFSEVDLERRVATLGDTKTGLSVRPLSSAAVEIIKRQSARDGQQFVFEFRHGKPLSNLNMDWNKLGTPKDVTPHTLRHSLASLAADLGLPDHTISGLLGHARQGITSRYMHLGDKALLEAADLVANETLRLMRA